MHRLGIIVPYRNREQHLQTFLDIVPAYLGSTDIDYRIIVVHQTDSKLFNRGKLLNIGFLEAKKLKCDYVVFHDVDMIPNKVDYSYSEHPIHLASDLVTLAETKKDIFEGYFGGVTMFTVKDFEAINGYSNDYWGWGFEDDDLLFRVAKHNLPTDIVKKVNTGAKGSGLKFNGYNSLVTFNNNIRWKQDFSIFISFFPDQLELNPKKRDDRYAAFGVPGYDFSLGFNSFGRYYIEGFDSNREYFNVVSPISNRYHTVLVATWDVKNKLLKLYQDGKVIGESKLTRNLFNYYGSKLVYLGGTKQTDNPEASLFKGVIDRFATFNRVLEDSEILDISTNSYRGLTQNYNSYNSVDALTLYYDAKFIKNYKLIDMSGNRNHGIIENCNIVECKFDEEVLYSIPFRRKSKFTLLSHEENGFINTGWKDINTRWNQLKFNNEVQQGWRDTTKDGLNNCLFKILDKKKSGRITNLTVDI